MPRYDSLYIYICEEVDRRVYAGMYIISKEKRDILIRKKLYISQKNTRGCKGTTKKKNSVCAGRTDISSYHIQQPRATSFLRPLLRHYYQSAREQGRFDYRQQRHWPTEFLLLLFLTEKDLD